MRSEEIDHIDLNPLNNCRNNLRIATSSQNKMNRLAPVNNTSGFKGVSWSKNAKKWAAYINIDGKRHYLGLFITAELAYKQRREKEMELFGIFAQGEI